MCICKTNKRIRLYYFTFECEVVGVQEVFKKVKNKKHGRIRDKNWSTKYCTARAVKSEKDKSHIQLDSCVFRKCTQYMYTQCRTCIAHEVESCTKSGASSKAAQFA